MFTRLRNAPQLDPRWSGRVRFGPYLLVPIIILLLLYALFTFTALLYAATHPDHWSTQIRTENGETYKYQSFVSGGAGGIFGFGAAQAA
jgi:hypothetical protein